jgi:1,4-alpha-glucan branching enzyme
MKKITFLFLLLSCLGFAQVTTSPSPAIPTGPVTLTFNKTGTGLASYNGTIYAHIGLTVNGNTWQYVKGTWGNNTTQPALVSVGGSNYQLTLSPDLYTYFGVPAGSTITQICVVFRAAAGSPQTTDYFINVGTFQVNLTAPAAGSTTILSSGGSLNIAANNTGGNASYNLLANGTSINSNASTSNYSFTHSNITSNQSYSLVVTQGSNTITKTFNVISVPVVIVAAMPAGLEDGINYNPSDPTKATLVLDAPGKDFVYVAGSFNNWQPSPAYAMYKDSSTGKFYLELTGLTAGQMYTYQYWVVDQTPAANSPALVKTADPYSTLVLSPFDDPYISATNYPNLPAYPAGQEREVTVLQTGQQPYNWQVTNFQKPKKEDLVIYEVLVRDFDSDRSYQDLIDKIDYFKNLKVNAIQLMPVMEFEGNESWGYNTSFHLANDKAYGPADKLKEFIDLCHQNGIAVILDVALNHAFGRNPMVRMWMSDSDGDGWGDPNSESPYFNTVATHSYSVGSDFNHQQSRTKTYVKRVVKHWIENYKIDGFRWDLTKGFTQNCAGSETCTNNYQQDRVDVLKEYADYSWSIDPNHYVIFEHLGNNNEESQWANYRVGEGKGIMLWGNMMGPYGQLTMGYADNSNFNGVGHASRGFTEKRLVGYAESHDEERLMYKNLTFGNATNASHNVKTLNTALSRMSALGAVLLPVPGPKMIWHFGELGWEKSIYTCNNGTVNTPTDATTGDCKLDTKPQPQWSENWLANVQRKKIYDDWAKMINLKINEPVFEGDYSINSGTLQPRIYVYNNSLPSTQLKNVVILANFGVTAQNVVPDFPYTGTWYNLMDNSTINVASTTAAINIPPGEFRMYGNQAPALSAGTFEAEKASLYPNPASDVFTLNIAASKVEIYSVTGQLVKAFSDKAAYTMYDVNDLTAGMYLVKVTDVNNRQSTTKLIRK